MASEESAAREQTPELPPTTPTAGADASQEDLDRRLVRELSARGVPPDEVARLLALGHKEPAGSGRAGSAPNPPPGPVLEEEPFVPRPTLTLPEPREATAEEQAEAGRILGRANLAYRRGSVDEALELCRQAVFLTPRDAVALELYGDVLQSLGRVDDALLCYRTAVEVAPNRASAERRYAELRLMQERSIALLQEELIPRNRLVAVLMSALLPGAGQLYNGEPVKGLAVALGALAFVVVLGWTPLGFRPGLTSIPPSLVLITLCAAALYVYAVVDASLGATRGKAARRKSGWEV